eukprot:TRINITY_DN1132_c0_g1_i2.p1 TRINITY_DN1132_c0_g1~~TRINITY_DN1132_c0_g1_i2.p1  ORF type:complete len:355 (-),score=37.22 TRINITY_DN1132_c0_g1_i2:33-1097(-)
MRGTLLLFVLFSIYRVSFQDCGSCASLNYNCGTALDNCNQSISCGSSDCKLGAYCHGTYPVYHSCFGFCNETTHRCDCGECSVLDMFSECGDGSDGCGRPCTVGCPADTECQADPYGPGLSCLPPPDCGTCASLGFKCSGPDNCGNVINCGTCTNCCYGHCYTESVAECRMMSPLGTSNLCYTCAGLNLQCGTRPAMRLDEHMTCSAIECGSCPPGLECVDNHCVTPTTGTTGPRTTSTGTTSTGTTSTGTSSTGTTSTGTTSTGTTSTGTTSTGTTSTGTTSTGTTYTGTTSIGTTSTRTTSAGTTSARTTSGTSVLGGLQVNERSATQSVGNTFTSEHKVRGNPTSTRTNTK